MSAAVYAASEGLKTVVIERWAIGGQAASSPKIENYLGFPGGISGAELADRARDQACRFGAELLLARESVKGEFSTGKRVGVLSDGTRIAGAPRSARQGSSTTSWRCQGGSVPRRGPVLRRRCERGRAVRPRARDCRRRRQLRWPGRRVALPWRRARQPPAPAR